MRLSLEAKREWLRAVSRMYAIDGEFVGPGWVLLSCRCAEADAAILAIEFDLRLAITTEQDQGGPPCGMLALAKLPLEHAAPDPQGRHD